MDNIEIATSNSKEYVLAERPNAVLQRLFYKGQFFAIMDGKVCLSEAKNHCLAWQRAKLEVQRLNKTKQIVL